MNYLVGFGLVYGRGGVRVLGEHTFAAPSLAAARRLAEGQRAKHEHVLYVEELPPTEYMDYAFNVAEPG